MIYTLDNSDSEQNGDGKNRIVSIVRGYDDVQNVSLKDADILDVLPLRNMVLFPGVLMPVAVGRPKSLKLVNNAYKQEKLLAVCCQKERDVQEPKENDLYVLGAAARVIQTIELQSGTLMVILEGVARIEVEEFLPSRNGLRARIKRKEEIFPEKSDKEFLALASSIKDEAAQILKNTDNVPSEASMTLKSIENPPTLVNYVCTNFDIKIEEKQRLLQIDSIYERAINLLAILHEELEMLRMKADISKKTKEELDKQQREFYLHQQMETIQRELGDTDEQIICEMQARADKRHWSDNVRSVFDNELHKLQRMPTHSPEYSTQQNYLETMLDLPWNEYSVDNYDIVHAKEVLDNEHYGMEKVKERIIEYLAVQRLLDLRSEKEKEAHKISSPILCLYGPPGVGKTSLGRLGGLHDESEIRGHRRTYIGAMPGRIIENLRKVQTSNPVFVLDEIDKIGADYKGDPTSALLEVLDPEQNSTFHDNFLGVDYDLSKVLFVATANTLDTIPRPLLDRMELIEMTGYLLEEKEEIAKRHLIPKELENHGLRSSQLRFKKEIIVHIIDDYTRESGVRSLDRQIAAICRKVDTKIALNEKYNVSLTRDDLIAYLGQPRYSRDSWENNKYTGVVTGLAWTQVGGEILFIEASLSPSKTPTLTLTGNLGEVMKESATIAMGYLKAHATLFGIKQKDIETHSVHIHVPEGAIPKDGPSAGITMTTALVSAFTGRKVRPRIAMTGEMTLRGKVLPIGGVKEKILAAKRAGITDLVLCEDNRKDVLEIPEIYLKGLTFHYVRNIQQVIDVALI